MHRILASLLLMLLLAACQPDSLSFNRAEEPSTPAPTPTPLPTPIRQFQATISADGAVVLPIPPQQFTFAGVSGTIAEVYVRVGQRVEAGDLLARVDDTDLQNAVKRAEASLESLRAQIAQEEAPALSGDIDEAEASLAAAQAELARLQSLPSEDAITQAAADLRLREVELQQAQEAYDAIAYSEGVGLSPQAAELQNATINYERALAAYNQATEPPTEAELASARLQVVQARNRLQQLEDGLRPEALAANQARLREAELELSEARSNLEKAYLHAPWDGEVTEVAAAPGVSVGTASITLAQVEPLRFATENFSERNLADIQPGDPATIYLKTYPGVPFPAVVQRVELQSTERDGDTALFTVYLDFNHADFEVRPGMTGRLEITVDEVPR